MWSRVHIENTSFTVYHVVSYIEISTYNLAYSLLLYWAGRQAQVVDSLIAMDDHICVTVSRVHILANVLTNGPIATSVRLR